MHQMVADHLLELGGGGSPAAESEAKSQTPKHCGALRYTIRVLEEKDLYCMSNMEAGDEQDLTRSCALHTPLETD